MVGREMNQHRRLLIIWTIVTLFLIHKVNENCCERKKENDKSEAFIHHTTREKIN